MCGIIGLCGAPHAVTITPDRLIAARDTMQSRGPDDAGYAHYEDGPGVHFGHRRLSIQDLSPLGAQPMVSGSGRYAIVYNGEVYNTATLRTRLEGLGHSFCGHSDTEVILEGFAAWGPDVVSKLNGMFAFAIWDRADQVLTLVRDRVGIKPLYMVSGAKGLAFASDARALRALGFGAEIDPDALSLYLALGYVPAPHCIWAGITKVPPGTIQQWRAGEAVQSQTYWTPPEDIDAAPNPTDLATLIDEVVEEQLVSDVPIGLFLSGGIDSSVVASSLAACGRTGDGIVAMTVGFPGQEDSDEAPLAERTAEHLGLPLRVLSMSEDPRAKVTDAMRSLDEPLAYSAIVTQTAISELARQAGVTVVLTGDGGDEGFAGYRWYDRPLADLRPPNARSLWDHIVPRKRMKHAEHALDAAWRGRSPHAAHAHGVYGGLRPDQIARLQGRSATEVEALILETLAIYDAPRLPELRRRQRLDLMTFCMDAVLSKVDRAGMAFGIETRPPLLDHRVLEWGLARPVVSGEAPKGPLRAILQDRGLGFLLDAPKRGFSLKAQNTPSLETISRDIGEMSPHLGLSVPWSDIVLRGTRHFAQRRNLLHWLALWRRETL